MALFQVERISQADLFIYLHIIEKMKATVTKTTGSYYWVRDDEGKTFKCRLKGNLRLKDYKFTNPIVVGDRVSINLSGNEDFIIQDVDKRKNYIVRRSVKLSKQIHIIASNIDQAALMVTISQPKTHLEFVDRYLVTADAYHIPAILLFNKADLYSDEEIEEMVVYKELYEQIGYKCIILSALKDESFEEIREVMKNKTTLFSGHSGVGKSTLLNRLDPSLNIKTSEVSDSFKSGKHTTTFAEMYEIQNLGMVIDTPGIKGLGVIDIPKEEISHYFPEMLYLIPECKFHNCTHIDEPSCAIKKALEEAKIDLSRYRSYLSIFDEEADKYR